MKNVLKLCVLVLLICAFMLSFASCNAKCKHKNVGEWNDGIEADCTESGIAGHYICADCGAYLDEDLAVIPSIEIAPLGHSGEFSTEKEASCEEEGLRVSVCVNCGSELFSEAIPPTGHNYEQGKTVIEPGANICENGAFTFSHCTQCEHAVKSYIEPMASEGIDAQHTVEVWTLCLAPTYNEGGLIEGRCVNEHCSSTVRYELPPLSSDCYTIYTESTAPACAGSYDAVFTFIADSDFKFIVDGEEKDSLIINETVPAQPHVLNGEKMCEDAYHWQTNGITCSFEALDCHNTDARGSYECEECHAIIEVAVFENHTVSDGKWNVTVEPTCENAGERYGICESVDCGTSVIDVMPAIGHDYKYELQYTLTESGEYIFTLQGVCTRNGCTSTVVHENIEGVTSSIFEPTCKEAGATVFIFSFVNSEIDYSTSQGSVTASVTVAQLEHTVGGCKIDENSDSPYDIDEYKILEPYASSAVGCLAPTSAIVTCDICGRDDITVYVYKNHIAAEQPEAECEAKEEDVECKFCKTIFTVSLDGTGHCVEEYLTAEETEEEGVYIIGGSCVSCGKVVYETASLTVTEEIAPTCTKPGYISYERASDGLSIVIEIAQKNHILGGLEMNNDPQTPYVIDKTPGIQTFAYSPVDSCCDAKAAYFVCDECNEVVYVNAVISHTVAEWSIITPATCETSGIKVGACSACKNSEVIEVIPATGHNYSYDFTLSTKILVATCQEEGCEHSYTLTRVKRDRIDSTCTTQGTITYTGLNEKGEETVVVVTTELLPHVLEGIETNELGAYPITVNEDGTVRVGSFAGEEFTCEEIVKGYYVCDCCGTKVMANVYQPHIPLDEGTVTLEPTCTKAGVREFDCAKCGNVYITEAIPETGHSYVFNIDVAPGEESTGIATGQCHCDKEETIEIELPKLTDGEYSVTVITKPTCIETGLSKYEYSLEIEEKEYTVSFELVISKIEYDPEISEASEVCVEEEISFIDPFGERITEVVSVVYRLFECPEEDCHVLLLLEKSFVYDENLYVYSFEENEFILTLPEGEK